MEGEGLQVRPQLAASSYQFGTSPAAAGLAGQFQPLHENLILADTEKRLRRWYGTPLHEAVLGEHGRSCLLSVTA